MPALKLIYTALFLFSLFSPLQVFAQSYPYPTPTPTPTAPNSQNWDAFKQSAFAGNGLINLFSCMGANIPFGTDGCPNVFITEKGPKTFITYNGEGGGALGMGTQLIAAIQSNPPASGVQYLANSIRNGFGFATPAYAQVEGGGSRVIAPLLRIWQVSRNIAYMFFIVIFMVVGLMIMFRQKLSAQAVITIQSSLPSLIVALALVTFSYFISGLIIDLAFLLSQAVGVLFLTQFGNTPDAPAAVRNLINSQNVVQMAMNFIISGNLWGAAGALGDSVATTLYSQWWSRPLLGILGALAACLNPAVLGAAFMTGPGAFVVCGVLGGLGGGIAGGQLISGIVFLIFLFGLLQAVFRLFFALLAIYVAIVVTTLTAPFIILWSAIPGQGNVLQLWWRFLLGNVLVFPAVFTALLLVGTILGFGGDWHLDGGRVGNFNQTLPLLGGVSVNFVQGLLAYGLVLALPGIPDLVRNALRAQANQILNQQIARGVQGGATVARQIAFRAIPDTWRAMRTRGWP